MAEPSTAPPLIPSSIAEAHKKIRPYIHVTPLITSKSLSAIASHSNPSAFLSTSPPPATESSTSSNDIHSVSTPKFNLYFKCENEQKIGAFKARGAHHALIRLIDTLGIEHVRQRGVITHSSGNHAQALALAAHNFNVPSYIVMPAISTPSKIAGTQMYTSNVVFSGSTSTEREAKVAELMERNGAILVPPYNHPDIILGQGTAALEMEQQFQTLKANDQVSSKSTTNGATTVPGDNPPRFDAVLAPIGGGGLLGGTATWFHHTSPRCKDTGPISSTPAGKQTLVFGSEPSFDGANDAERGLAQSPPERIEHVSSLTIADGLRTPVGVINWSIVSDKDKVRAVYSVTEQQIKDALRLMMERAKTFVEPSAVVPVAVVLFCQEFRNMVARMQAEEGKGRAWDVGIILSGGNTTVEALARLFKAEDNKEGSIAEERQTAEVGMDGVRKAEDVAG